MRSSSDLVEQLGVERSAAAAAAADVVIMVVDAAQGWTDADGDIFDSLWGKEGPGSRSCKVRGPALLVANKQDLAGRAGIALSPGARGMAALQVMRQEEPACMHGTLGRSGQSGVVETHNAGGTCWVALP